MQMNGAFVKASVSATHQLQCRFLSAEGQGQVVLTLDLIQTVD